ncbi:hypothetical protein GCM10023230_16160 [Flavobacterium hankyongi]|uniref:Uncharacterized protein n=1 Tax=Flavobacterium hankyongi TaxID=1176532 RepID=A0ABP8ZVW5_9FLAO
MFVPIPKLVFVVGELGSTLDAPPEPVLILALLLTKEPKNNFFLSLLALKFYIINVLQIKTSFF